MDVFTCAFFGHRDFCGYFECEKRLTETIKELILEKEYVVFLVGREGEFDKFVASIVRKVKKEYFGDNSSLVWVMPYLKADYKNNEEEYDCYYDEIEICDKSQSVHFKSAIKVRNYEMINRADLIICYVEHQTGNTFKTVEYAKKQGKNVVNLYE